jgi:hypothetical protein
MTDMQSIRTGALFVVLLFAALPAGAQDGDTDEAGNDTAAAAALAAEREALMPAASTSNIPPGTDTLVLERTEITGNRELPKVLYIVPWRKSDPGALVGKPVNTLLDEVLAPVDREEFIRQVDYYSDLYGNAATGEVPQGDTASTFPADAEQEPSKE